MSEHKSLSVLIPVVFPLDPDWITKQLGVYLNQQAELILLHVVDTRIRDTLHKSDIRNSDEIFNSLKVAAESRLHELKNQISNSNHVNTIVVEGIPFTEIVKIGKDLKVDMVAMKIRSTTGDLQNIFFGSTTEQVVRASSVPVFCIP